LMVFQVQLAHRNDTLPLTRDYIGKCEKALAIHEAAHETAPPPAPARKRRKVSE
jgi:cyclopropane-fatty-acyl-phospholipid synthase